MSTLSAESQANRKAAILLIIGIIFVAFNLRPAITSVGPLIPVIRESTGMSNSLAGTLTTIPLLSFAVFSLVAPKLGLRFGNQLAIFFALLTLAAGILIRSSGVIAFIFIGTALIGIGIAICNVLLPGVIKFSFPQKVGLMTSIYTMCMGTFASIGSGLSFPLSESLGLGWENALAVWVIITVVALIVWLPQIKGQSLRKTTAAQNGTAKSSASMWSSRVAWHVTLFMGFQSFLFYSLITWIPDVLQELGMSLSMAGWMLFWLQLVGIPFSFAAPILADKLENQKPIVTGICSLYFIGFTGLIFFSHLFIIIISVICLGIAQGAAISLALTMISLRAANARHASLLSGMAQSCGYLLAALGPVFMGFLYDTFHTWQPFLYVSFFIAICILWFGLHASENRYALPEDE
ncbi:MFS transporter, CP family, cyanate transporter [Alteribacillus persepolensis]|uniref:MFS transporter, CP family, cyanate transporter n=1 Tax=Alteribacillus persepolensis TaxID=568899 RepID=A0A1G8A9X5_9BACI|nr:MFS transporter [Alteribacillus persepolensis]SDH17646.1 MFS transporter, CP family, cyanate transporter [Alteribacillus persepolensis]